MPIQQSISTNLLFIKHRKLYYLLTSDEQTKIVYKIYDFLNIKDFHSLKSVQTICEDSFLISDNVIQNQISETKHTFKQIVKFPDSFENGNKDLIVYNFTDRVYQKVITKITEQKDVTSIKYKDYIQQESKSKDYKNQNNDNVSFVNFNQKLQIDKKSIEYDGNQPFEDKQNYLIIKDNNNEYTFHLYIDDQFLQDCKNIQFKSIVAKDLIFNGCQNGHIYLKLYDKNNVFIKKFQLKKTSIFNVQLNNVCSKQTKDINQSHIQFDANSFYFNGYNIYHDNNICKQYHCNFSNNDDLLFSTPIRYKIIQSLNTNKDLPLILYNDSYVIVRCYFDKIVYLKNLKINTNIYDKNYNFQIRLGIVQKQIFKKQFDFCQNINNRYCKFVDVKINYYGNWCVQLNSIYFYVYQYVTNNVFYSNYQLVSSNDSIYVTKEILLDLYGLTSKPQLFSYHEYLSDVQLKNINTETQGCFLTSNNTFEQSEIYISLSKDKINFYPCFRYISIQYDIEKVADTSLFTLQNFQIKNKKYNFPKYFQCETNGINNVFKHNSQISFVDNKYIEKWESISNKDYFCFSHQKISQSNDSWKTMFYLNFNGKEERYQLENITFVQQDSKFGFKLHADNEIYYFKKTKQQKSSLKIYTLGSYHWQLIRDNLFSESQAEKRKFKIVFQDGDTEKIKLYNIVFKTFNSSNLNKFYPKNTQLINISGNTTRESTEIINNNFYNVAYFVNYAHSSILKGFQLQSERSYFDKSQFKFLKKSNVHFSWNKQQKVQYIILFDQFDYEKYSSYFLPFKDHQKEKENFHSKCFYINKQMFYKQFYYRFDSIKIVSGLRLNQRFSLTKNIKFDYFVKFSQDNIRWSDFQYCNPFRCFYAKYVVIRCVVKSFDNTIDQQQISLNLLYFDSQCYYLTDQNFFDSIMLTELKNSKYLFLLKKHYNGQFVDSQLKLLEIQSTEKNPKITDLYVDDKKQNDYQTQNPIKISGLDNFVDFKFSLPTVIKEQIFKFNIKIYCSNNLIDDLYLMLQKDQNNYYNYRYSVDISYLKPFNIFSYSVLYFDNNHNISQFSDKIYFVFNNIPTVPQDLHVINNVVCSEGFQSDKLE